MNSHESLQHPHGVNPEKFHLAAPYKIDPRRWLKMPWTDQYSGEQYRITTEGFHATRRKARVKTYGDVLREYEVHPGSPSADAHGKSSGKQTIGLLRRRHLLTTGEHDWPSCAYHLVGRNCNAPN